MTTMSPAFSIAFLFLLAAAVVTSLDGQTEEEDFPSQRQKRAGHHAEEKLLSKDVCGSCKSLIMAVKKKMIKDTSKAKIAKLVANVCNQGSNEEVAAACKKITAKIKDKLSEAIANGDDPESACIKVKFCKENPPPRL